MAKESKDIIHQLENLIIQIATPFSTGTGFYVDEWKLIITNEHVVRGNRSVVVAGKKFEKQLVDIVYLDARYDIAFLKPPKEHSMPSAVISDGSSLREGDRVIAVGHPFDLKYTATQGIVSSLTHQEGDIYYVQHDAALNPGNSGGPLLDTHGQIVGINTFIIQNGNSIGFSLPSRYLMSSYQAFQAGKGKPGLRCMSCQKVTFDQGNARMKYCENCGAALTLISQIPEYQPKGVGAMVEDIIQQLGFDTALSRKGPNSWVLKKKKVTLYLTYYERNGMLLADSVLCSLPEGDIAPMYSFLLLENYSLQAMLFSIQGQDVLFSANLFDQYIEPAALKNLIDRYVACAVTYDEILINRFHGRRKEEV